MNYLLNLCRLPILSLVLSSLFLGALPLPAEAQFVPTKAINAKPSIAPVPKLGATPPLALSQTKVSPELEKQILEVIRRNPAVVLETLRKYATEQQQKDQKLAAEALKSVRKDTKSLIGDSPVTGAADRKIVMIEFSDFQCPYCATASKSVKQFMAKHKDKVTLVYKYFPLTQIHPEALPAARAAWAANRQGKFWEYHDLLFTNQARLGETLYTETATKLKLDLKRFNSDRKNADNAVIADYTLGRKLGIEGTPTVIMNGETISGGLSVADLEKVLAQVTKK